jgi:hypothetical protein
LVAGQDDCAANLTTDNFALLNRIFSKNKDGDISVLSTIFLIFSAPFIRWFFLLQSALLSLSKIFIVQKQRLFILKKFTNFLLSLSKKI